MRDIEQIGSSKPDDEFQCSVFNAESNQQQEDLELYSIGQVKNVNRHDPDQGFKKAKTEEFGRGRKFNDLNNYDDHERAPLMIRQY